MLFVYIYGVEDMPAGQTPHTIIMFAHNDLVDAVQPMLSVYIYVVCVYLCSVCISMV